MASPAIKTLSDGTIRYLARWREGGRGGTQKTIPFSDERTRDRFIDLVNLAGNRMPDEATLHRFGFDFLVPERARALTAGERVSLVAYAREFIGTLDNVHRQTRQKYGRYVDQYLEPYFERTDIRTVTRAMMRDWQRYMTGVLELSGKTVRNVRGTVLAPMFTAATLRGDHGEAALLDFSPMDGLAPPRTTRYHRQQLECTAHAQLLFDAAFTLDQDAYELLYLLAHFGNRWGEAAAIHADQCHLAGRSPYVEISRKAVFVSGEGWVLEPGAKTEAGAYRRQYVSDDVGAILARRCGRGPGLLFPHPDGGLWPHGTFYRDRWQPTVALARRAGLPYDLTMHGLRKTWATAAFEGGADPVTVATHMGHEDPAFTIRAYTQATGRGRDTLTAAVSAFYPRAVSAA